MPMQAQKAFMTPKRKTGKELLLSDYKKSAKYANHMQIKESALEEGGGEMLTCLERPLYE